MRKRARAKKPRVHQRTFDELGPGGKRKGAGRKPKGKKAGVSHRPRSDFKERFPVHITIKLVKGLPGPHRQVWGHEYCSNGGVARLTGSSSVRSMPRGIDSV